MNTRKPISTISFNTKDFLTKKLEELVEKKVLEAWYAIFHLGEDDEAGKKNHFHVYMEPAKQIQTMELKQEFNEYEFGNKLPLGCLKIQNSRFDHWYLYAIHDGEYLESKSLEKEFHYKYEDIIAFNNDELYREVKLIDFEKITPIKKIKENIKKGIEYEDAFYQGNVPIHLQYQYENAYITVGKIMKKKEVKMSNKKKGKGKGIGIVVDMEELFEKQIKEEIETEEEEARIAKESYEE